MNDLTVAIMSLGCAILACLLGGFWIGCRRSRSSRVAVQLVAVALMVGYITCLWNQPVLTQLLPTSSLIVLANWLPLWGSFFVGIYVASQAGTYRRATLSVVTLLLCVYSSVAPTLGKPPRCAADRVQAELHSQTTPRTCSAACAVSVLRLHGIEATENELAELCLTREGTHWLGLYRGLMLKTADSAWTVVVEPFSETTMMRLSATPCVLSVNVDTKCFEATVDHGFKKNVGHSVVYLGQSGPRRIAVFDPSPDFGVEDWDHEIFQAVTSGVVLRLVPRQLNDQHASTVTRGLATRFSIRNLTARL
ncbi:MAG: hypothetical protein GY758_07545 [Fuerstiella sp.]|nr:hypothetical protein [Fuerstiella sp.]MCP4785054.1 hypothetical protein [Fuerstiella sp.]MCP4853668.1 hypothetical protein [Fuerstiella sp.]